MTSATMLQVEHLSVDFINDTGWARVVDDVSFAVTRGEVMGLVGETGSGKSITSRAIMGLVPSPPGRVADGQVWLDGVELTALRRHELEDVRGNDVAMIFQEPMTSLNPVFTVGAQIAETVRRHRRVPRRQAWASAVEAMDRVGIPHAARRARAYPHEYSGGMRQRVAIAMALCCDPKLLIADEPTTALDVTTQAQVLDLIRQMRDEYGLSILFITHDLGVVADVCDRVVVMYAGQVVEEAGVVELFNDAKHPYSQGLLKSIPTMTARTGGLHVIDGQPPLAGAVVEGCRFHPRCPFAEDACSVNEIALSRLSPTRSSRCIRLQGEQVVTTGARGKE